MSQSNKGDTNDTQDLKKSLDAYLKNSRWGVTIFAGHRDILVEETAKFIAQETTKAVVAELERLHTVANRGNFYASEIRDRIESLTAEKEPNE